MTFVFRALQAVGLALVLALLTACATQPRHDASATFQEGKAAYLDGHYSRAFELLLGEAQQGNADAQYTIGYMYYLGQGVQQDRDSALRWIQRSAESGNERAREALGLLSGMGNRQQDQTEEELPQAPATDPRRY